MMSTQRKTFTLPLLGVLLLFAHAGLLHAQSGDGRGTLGDPGFPTGTICATENAPHTISGGEPASEDPTSATSTLQTDLTNCGNNGGGIVRLIPAGTGGTYRAFVIKPIEIPSGVILQIDASVVLFGSRVAADYAKTGLTCGNVTTAGGGCKPLITIASGSGSGIVGYGTINGRGADDLWTNYTGTLAKDPNSWSPLYNDDYAFWDNSNDAYLKNPVENQNNPFLIYASTASNFLLYKITLVGSPEFNVRWSGDNSSSTMTTDLTVWDIKIIEPYTARNTDGIDPTDNIENVTIGDSFISNGDDMIALSENAEGKMVQAVTINGVHTYDGRGISIGSGIYGGITNVLVEELNQLANPNDTTGNSNGIRIKSGPANGGEVSNVLYLDVCQQNEVYALRFDPLYDSGLGDGTDYPNYQNIKLTNIHILANQSPMGASQFDFRGLQAAPATFNIDKLTIDYTADVTPAPQYETITLSGYPSTASFVSQLTGTGVTVVNDTSGSQSPHDCTATNTIFPSLAGELFLSTSFNNSNLQTMTVNPGSAFTLNAVLEATSAEYPALTSEITFYKDGVAISGGAIHFTNGNLAAFATTADTNANTTHTYTASYPAYNGDPEFTFGSVVVKTN